MASRKQSSTFESRLQELERIYCQDGAQQATVLPDDPVQWIEQTRVLKGAPFSFKDREYLKQIYRDQSREIYIRKGRQAEITELLANLLVYNAAKYPNTVSLFMSNNWQNAYTFSNMRLRDMAIDASPAWQELFDDKEDLVRQKKLGNGSTIAIRSSWNRFKEARSLPVDFLYADEIQSTDVEALDVALESMSHSEYGRLVAVGTGAPEGSAWHLRYRQASEHKWDKQTKQWRKTTDGIDGMTAYHIPQSILSWISDADIERKLNAAVSKDSALQEIEGEFTTGAERPITDTAMRLCVRADMAMNPKVSGDTYLGVDWGGGRNFTALWLMTHAGKTDSGLDTFTLCHAQKIQEKSIDVQAEQVINFIDTVNPAGIAVDIGGGLAQVERLQQVYADRITRVLFVARPTDTWKHHASEARVDLDRTSGIDGIVDIVKQCRYNIPADAADLIIPHFTCIRGTQIKLAGGQGYTRYEKDATANNDLLMACVYAHTAYRLHTTKPVFYGGIAI